MRSIPRALATRLTRLEAQHERTAPQPLLLVRLYQGETRDTALQAAGFRPEGVSGSLVVFLRRPWPHADDDAASQARR